MKSSIVFLTIVLSVLGLVYILTHIPPSSKYDKDPLGAFELTHVTLGYTADLLPKLGVKGTTVTGVVMSGERLLETDTGKVQFRGYEVGSVDDQGKVLRIKLVTRVVVLGVLGLEDDYKTGYDLNRGDVVTFKVTFNDKPRITSSKAFQYLQRVRAYAAEFQEYIDIVYAPEEMFITKSQYRSAP